MTALVNDMVLLEDNCNLSCGYCLTGQSQFKKHHSLKLIFEPPKPVCYGEQDGLARRIDTSLSAVERSLQLPIIKVTGGEIFLIRGILDFLRELSRRYATVVIQTNGTLLDDATLADIKRWGNACLQLSLDASSFAGNAHRSRTPEQHCRVMERIERALDAGIPTEIYTVLTEQSVPALAETLDWLLPWAGHAVLAPFPVRGPDRDQFYPRPEQIPIVGQTLGDARYAELLPPAPYVRRLLRFLADGERRFRCHLPRFAFTLFDDGAVTPCPNIWFNHLGNVLVDDAEWVISRIGKTAFYELLLAQRPRIDACKRCFTPWDLLSLFIDGEITLDELCRTPMYAAPASRARIAEIAASVPR